MDLGARCDGEWCLPATPGQAVRLRPFEDDAAPPIYRPFCIPTLLVVDGPVDAGRLAEAAAGVVREHEALRYVFHRHDGGEWAVTSTPSVPDDLVTRVSMSELKGLAALDLRASPRLEPLLRSFQTSAGRHLAIVVAGGGSEHRILVLVDHLVCDAVGNDTLLEALSAAYADLSTPGPVDERGRVGLRRTAQVQRSIALTKDELELAHEMRNASCLAWANLPSKDGEIVRISDSPSELEFSLGDSPEDFARICREAGMPPFTMVVAALNKRIAELHPDPGYLYVYPTFRAAVGAGDCVGWFSGTALVPLLGPGAADRDFLRHARVGVAGAMTRGWAATEQIHQIGEAFRGVTTRTSLSLLQAPGDRPAYTFGKATAVEASEDGLSTIQGRVSLWLDAPRARISAVYESWHYEEEHVASLLAGLV